MTPRACVLLFLVWLSSACASREHLPSTPPPAEYGTPHPFVLQASAPDGQWLLACQAREDTNQDGTISVQVGDSGETSGDEARMYLFLKPGAGLAVDDVLTVDAARRLLVVVREGALRLLDTTTGQEQVLAPWTADDVGPGSPQPPFVRASFSKDGQRLLYLRGEAGKPRVAVLRDVASGEERVLDAGPGLLGQAVLHESGRWAWFDVVEKDTDEDGALTWPHQTASLPPSRCRGPMSPRAEWKGDRPVRRFLRVDGGTLLEDRDILLPLGDGLLRKTPHGAIVYEDAQSNQRTWVPERCRAQLFAVDEPRQVLVVGCKTSDPLGLRLELHGPELHLSFESEVSPYSPVQRAPGERPRLLPTFVLTGKDTLRTYALVLLDMERHALVPPPLPTSAWVHTLGAHALLKEGSREEGGEPRKARLWLWNADTGENRLVGEQGAEAESRANDLLLTMGWLVDLGTGQVLGPVEGEPLAINTRGEALRSTRAAPPTGADAAKARAAPLGPVKWEPAVKTSVKPTSPPVAPPPSGP